MTDWPNDYSRDLIPNMVYLGMAGRPNMPNAENCSLAELDVAAKASPR